MTQAYVVCALSDFPPGSRRLVKLAGQCIALFNQSDHLYAVDDSCPHAGASLAAGQLDDRFIQCRAHGLRFNLATGVFRPGSDLCVATYQVSVVDGDIVLHLPDSILQGKSQ